MEKFLKLINSTYDDKEKLEYITNLISKTHSKKSKHLLYDFQFAINVATGLMSQPQKSY